MTSRRKFLRTAGAGVMATAGAGLIATAGAGMTPIAAGVGTKGSDAEDHLPLDALQLGIAGYSFLHVPIDGAIAMMKRVGVTNLSLKDFFLPLDSSPGTIHTVAARFRDAGIRIYAAGVIYMKTVAEVDRAFEYARVLEVGLIVGAPDPELLPHVEERVKASGIRIAIHNHGPEDKLYPSPVNVYEHVKGLDERIGLCLDIGHAARAGADLVKVVKDYAPRIFDLHIKDLAVISKEPRPIELGRGVLDIPGLLAALVKIRYAGVCSMEHEMDMNDPMPGIAESAGFFRGVVKTLPG